MAILPSLADAPNTLREYETIYILKPDTNNDKVGEVNDRVKTIIEERGGQVLNVDNWGKRKLAYEIKKERKGIYLYWQFLGTPEIVSEFERNMRMIDPVMRYMTIKLDTNLKAGSRESEVNDETYEKASATAADEEELVTGRSKSEEEVKATSESDETPVVAAAEAATTEAATTEAATTEAATTEAATTEAATIEAATTEAATTEAAAVETTKEGK